MLSVDLAKLSFNSDAVVYFMRKEGGWALFAAGLALIQVIFTAGVIVDVLLVMFTPTLAKFNIDAAKIFLWMLGFGVFGAFFLESVMFFFIINRLRSAALFIAFLTGGLGLASKIKLPQGGGFYDAFTMNNVAIALLVVSVIYAIHEIAQMYNETTAALNPNRRINDGVNDALINVADKEIKKIK